ncbi:SPOR domain-containing protein [Serratia microhaemolytica]|uniref:SPOR domain-containing protein n=1 Tax=Serratia microhaemolytica TaxID=2675110 RepID=UPI001392457A|nr:SPOR domain-containing protein [Serratia microhaemolytica]
MKKQPKRFYTASLPLMTFLAPVFLCSPVLNAAVYPPGFALQIKGDTPPSYHPVDMYDHGVMFINGDGVPQDLQRGRHWILRAAQLGYPLAQYSLGMIFQQGVGIEPNVDCARQWFLLASQAQDEIGYQAKQAIAALDVELLKSGKQRPKIYRPPTQQECGQLQLIDPVQEQATAGTTPDIKLPDISATRPVLPMRNTPSTPSPLIAKEDMPKPTTPELTKPPASSSAPLTVAGSVTQSPPLATAHNLGGELRTAPKSHYTLQLAASREADDLEQIAEQYALGNYLVYQTERNGQQWFVLVYGQFKNNNDAKQGVRSLPEPLQAKSPWARRLSQVQQELQASPSSSN